MNNKPLKWQSPNGKGMMQEEVEMMFQSMLLISQANKAPVEPPKDLRDFEDRIGEVEIKLRNLFFGFNHDVGTGKTIKREKSHKNIVEALCNYDKYAKGLIIINEQLNPFELFLLILENDVPFLVCDDLYLLGFTRDRSGLSLPQKNVIAVQVAAQVLWHIEKNTIPTITAMRQYLLNEKNPIYSLLGLERFSISSRARTIENWISEMFPVPKGKRRCARTSRSGLICHFDDQNDIPGIILQNRKVINFLKLRFKFICFIKILMALKWPVEEISKSKLLLSYLHPLKIYPYLFLEGWVNRWIDEAVAGNGSIFDS